jgi:hypothetical protein
MTDLKRTIKCANCGSESSVYLNSDIEVRELLFAGKCRCGSSLQVSFSVVGEGTQGEQKSESSEPVVNIDESLFPPEIPSDTLRDLMED